MSRFGRQPPEQIPKPLAAVDIHAALVCQVADLMPCQAFPSLPHKEPHQHEDPEYPVAATRHARGGDLRAVWRHTRGHRPGDPEASGSAAAVGHRAGSGSAGDRTRRIQGDAIRIQPDLDCRALD